MPTTLVVEDRSVDRQSLSALLTSAGHTVVEASDGLEALHLAERRLPDLVISDILMPTIDGSEFVRRLRAVAALARTPVIFYAPTYHEREARALADECGVTQVLTKPSQPEMILATVDAALVSRRRKTAVRPAARSSTVAAVAARTTLDGPEPRRTNGGRVAAPHQITAERDPRRCRSGSAPSRARSPSRSGASVLPATTVSLIDGWHPAASMTTSPGRCPYPRPRFR